MQDKKKSARAVVLLSGGIDSTTCLAMAQAEGFECHALSFYYQQRHHIEMQAARRVAEAHGVAEHLILELPFGRIGGSALTSDLEVPKSTNVDEIYARHSNNLCAGPQYHISLGCAGVGRSP